MAYLGCGKVYERGLHHLGELTAPGSLPPAHYKRLPAYRSPPHDAGRLAKFVADANFVVVGHSCNPTVESGALTKFVKVGSRDADKEELWVRRKQ